MTKSSPTPAETALGAALQRLRQAQNLSLRTLAARAGFSPSFVSQVENGITSPSIASLERLAATLGIGLADFFGELGDTSPSSSLAPQSELESAWSRARLVPLLPDGTLDTLRALLITVDPGGQSSSRPSARPYDQVALVLEGRLLLVLGDVERVLASGEAAGIPAGLSYRWTNTGDRTARVAFIGALGHSQPDFPHRE